jgi:hypothetical protein
LSAFSIEQRNARYTSLVGADCVHPSMKEYAEWEKLIFPTVFELLIK